MVHHRRGLRRLLKDDALLARIDTDVKTSGLNSRRLAILAYAGKLTRSPEAMTAEDLEPMRDTGLSDVDILAVAEVTAYYAYVNRIADGLGVVLE